MKAAFALVVLLLAAPKKPDVFVPDGFWATLPPPKAGDWRWRFPEEGQTFAEYKAMKPVRATPARRKIYLQPLLTRPLRDDQLLRRVATVLRGFFDREVSVLPPRPLPLDAYARKRRQVSILHLVPHLMRGLPEDGLFLLAVTDRDLFVGKLQHAYGWGSLRFRVGIMSTYRMAANGDEVQRRRRLITLATHEAGHMISLMHCTFYKCLMNGARTLEEADARPALLCPVCRAKLCWNLGAEPLRRYESLAAAFEKAGLSKTARRTRRALDVTRFSNKG